MKTFLRAVAAVFAGVFVLIVLLVATEMFSAVVHPFPADFQGTEEEVCRHVQRYPAWVLAVCLPFWVVAALVSTWTARRVGNLYSAAVVGLLVVAGLVCNISMLPYPLWFKVGCVIVIPAAVLLGSRPWRKGEPRA